MAPSGVAPCSLSTSSPPQSSPGCWSMGLLAPRPGLASSPWGRVLSNPSPTANGLLPRAGGSLGEVRAPALHALGHGVFAPVTFPGLAPLDGAPVLVRPGSLRAPATSRSGPWALCPIRSSDLTRRLALFLRWPLCRNDGPGAAVLSCERGGTCPRPKLLEPLTTP